MSRTLKMQDALLARARRLHERARYAESLPVLRRLFLYPNLPDDIAAEVHARLADAYAARGEFRPARKHLSALLKIKPHCPDAHRRMAKLLERDPRADARRAVRHYRKAMALAPSRTDLMRDCGRLIAEVGRAETGLDLLRRAMEQTPDDLSILETLVEALCELGRVDEARRELQLARFRQHSTAGYDRIISDFHFRRLRAEAKSAGFREAPMVLPFLKVRPALRRRTVRRDVASLPMPHLFRITGRPDTRHAH